MGQFHPDVRGRHLEGFCVTHLATFEKIPHDRISYIPQDCCRASMRVTPDGDSVSEIHLGRGPRGRIRDLEHEEPSHATPVNPQRMLLLGMDHDIHAPVAIYHGGESDQVDTRNNSAH
jgi:hypothetical protein